MQCPMRAQASSLSHRNGCGGSVVELTHFAGASLHHVDLGELFLVHHNFADCSFLLSHKNDYLEERYSLQLERLQKNSLLSC